MKKTDVEIEILSALRALAQRAARLEALLRSFQYTPDETGQPIAPRADTDKARP